VGLCRDVSKSHGYRFVYSSASTERAPSVLQMPGFAERMDDAEVAELATFLRQGWSNHVGVVTAEQVRAVRASQGH
jgi:mono/diheme cytochrome c family protein